MALAVTGCRCLPVRKQDALCCPDFPLLFSDKSDRTFCVIKVRVFDGSYLSFRAAARTIFLSGQSLDEASEKIYTHAWLTSVMYRFLPSV